MKNLLASVFIFIKKLFIRLLSLYGLLALVGTIAAFWPASCWFCDLMSHFRFNFLIFAIGMLLFQVFRKRWRWVLPCLLIIGLNTWSILPLYTVLPATPKGDKLAQFKVLQFNLYYNNTNVNNVISFVKQQNADIIAFQEVERQWPKLLSKTDISKLYPYVFSSSGSGNVLYSKYPILDSRERGTQEKTENITRKDFIETTVNIQNNLVHVFVVHTSTPVLPANLALQQDYLRVLAERVKSYKANEPVVVVGDFNTSPFSAEYKQFLSVTGLKDSQMGLGVQPTWPSVLPSIPIDHIFVSNNIKVNSKTVGPFVANSDHLPVTATLSLYGKKPDTTALLKALTPTVAPHPHCPGAQRAAQLPKPKNDPPIMELPPGVEPQCTHKAKATAAPVHVCTTCPKPCNTCDPQKKH